MPDTSPNTFLSCFSRRFLIEKDLDVYIDYFMESARVRCLRTSC